MEIFEFIYYIANILNLRLLKIYNGMYILNSMRNFLAWYYFRKRDFWKMTEIIKSIEYIFY